MRGSNIYLPYALFLHSPALPSASLPKGALEAGIHLYLTNDFHSYKRTVNTGEDEYYRISDFENIRVEVLLHYQWTARTSFAALVRTTHFYGGFLDSLIEDFHQLFGFNNAGREHFDTNQVYINMANYNGMDISAEGPVNALGDTDLWVKYAIPVSRADTAVWAGIKAPTGAFSGSNIVSSGYPDAALQYTADIPLHRLLNTYLQAGVTFPFNSLFSAGENAPTPFLHGLIAFEYMPAGPLSSCTYLAQLNVKTSVLSGSIEHWLFDTDRLSLPQTNLLFGLVYRKDSFRWQLYFEEDFLTNQGADITVGLQVSRVFE